MADLGPWGDGGWVAGAQMKGPDQGLVLDEVRGIMAVTSVWAAV